MFLNSFRGGDPGYLANFLWNNRNWFNLDWVHGYHRVLEAFPAPNCQSSQLEHTWNKTELNRELLVPPRPPPPGVNSSNSHQIQRHISIHFPGFSLFLRDFHTISRVSRIFTAFARFSHIFRFAQFWSLMCLCSLKCLGALWAFGASWGAFGAS